MNDQATNLRRLKEASLNHKKTRVIAVTSGKGGVGKTNISLNFALGLAAEGKKVLLFDLDIGMANIDILLGISTRLHITDLIEGNATIWEIMKEGPLGTCIITGGSGFKDVFTLSQEHVERFTNQLLQLDGHFDFIIFDMGAGASKESLQFILSAHEYFLVTTPEPTSITDGYAMIKYIYGKNSHIPASLIVNRTANWKEGRSTAYNIQQATERFLGKEITFLGCVPQDSFVLQSVKKQDPFYTAYPRSAATQAIRQMVYCYLGEREDKQFASFHRFINKLTAFMKGDKG
ncbi:MinD/ParA family protein [Alteribacillus iranensis]|uniref:Flagellar biosynthesis protein FlhG n=1 Tax=Alteribacillus iranensis TaxID=930128 RepID=A0A1I2A3P9_9BACI|nr:MinD/ParA family protein [Alteribacillus iranensis]SFE38665.1 flagellar biosynthesis protein FlhG [Alteribacillus iranensis]